ncbi:hypothetical protein CCYA_CCYA19G4687 [Cyanidiococcus yangmingshanensis]|nr:hypothetical protein CCYA_CCYA19G4687 [Cyanidiococcus yangmingshanensis]
MIREHLDEDFQPDGPKVTIAPRMGDSTSTAKLMLSPSANGPELTPTTHLETAHQVAALKCFKQKIGSPQGCCEVYWQQAALQIERLQCDVETLQGNLLCLEQQLKRALYQIDGLVSETQAARLSFAWAPREPSSQTPLAMNSTASASEASSASAHLVEEPGNDASP